MNILFLKLLNMSISAGWLVLAVLVLRLCLKKAPKWVSVLLWGIVAIRLILPFSIESVLSLIPSVQTVPMDIELSTAPAVDTGVTVLNNAVNPILAQSVPSPGASVNPMQVIIAVCANVWLLGVAVMALYTAISYLRLRRRVRTAVRLQGNIYQSEQVDSPFVLGLLFPRIYLPFSMDAQALSHVIAHENAHIRRKDHWWKPLGFLLLTLHWFNPLMWLAYILLCRDIELACDEKVIKELGCDQRADYTQALLSCSVSRKSIAACPLAFGEVGVKNRVKSVLNYKKPAFWIIVASVAVCAVVAVCFLTDPPQSTVQDIYAQKGYTILEQEPETITLQIPTDGLNELIYTQEGYQFKPGEVVVWREDSATIYLSHVQLQNEAPYDYLYFTFGFDYKITDYGSFRSATQINLDSDPPSTSGPVLFVPDNTMFDSAGQIFPDALNERGHNDDGSITLYVSKDACKSARGIMLMDVQLNRIRYAKNGFEDEAAAFFEDLNTGITDLTPNDMVFRADTALQKKIRKELDLPSTQRLTYAGEYSVGENTLLWIYHETNGVKTYIPVACSQKASGAYKFKEILRTMTYTTDIVNTVWMGESIYLINNPNCKSIIYKDENGNIVQQIDIGENEHPYVFLMSTPVSPCTCTFADANGNDLQFYSPEQPSPEFDFLAEVLEVHNDYLMVKPGDGWLGNKPAMMEVPVTERNLGASPKPQVGDTLIISTDGVVQEIYPPRLAYVSRIRVVDVPEFTLPRMIMVNGELYTDMEIEGITKNHSMIQTVYISSAVRQNQRPTTDNQANFETPAPCYYHAGSIEGTIEVNIDGSWWIFANEAVRSYITSSGGELPKPIPVLNLPAGSVTLSAKELETVDGWFAWDGDMFNYPITNSFLAYYYRTPDELSMFELFGPGCGDNQAGQISNAERTALSEKNPHFSEGYEVNKIKRSSMDNILRQNTGFGLEDRVWLDLEAFTYLEEYDAYYVIYGGTNWWYYNVVEGYRCPDGSLILVCEKPSQWEESTFSVLTLRPAETGEGFHGYWFVSNLYYEK